MASEGRISVLRDRLEDAEGEAGACSDRDCSCKSRVADLRWELEEAEREEPHE